MRLLHTQLLTQTLPQTPGTTVPGFRPGHEPKRAGAVLLPTRVGTPVETILPVEPPKDGQKHILLVGGSEGDLRTMDEKLRPLGVAASWHWHDKNVRGHFPQCEAVILHTAFVAHSLVDMVKTRAKNAGVPIIHHSTWPRTVEALRKAGIVPPVEAPPPAPAPVIASNKGPSDEDVVVSAHDTWSALSATTQESFRALVVTCNENRAPHVLAEDLRAFCQGFDKNPRAFVAVAIIATRGHPVTQAALQRLMTLAFRKKVDSTMVNRVSAKVTDFCGADFGIRKGEFPKFLPRAVPEVTPPPPPQEPIVSPPVQPAQLSTVAGIRARARFQRLLQLALDEGEEVRVKRVGGEYVLTYADGVSVRVVP